MHGELRRAGKRDRDIQQAVGGTVFRHDAFGLKFNRIFFGAKGFRAVNLLKLKMALHACGQGAAFQNAEVAVACAGAAAPA